ncbi:MAG TPA: hypothetical protein VEJ46_02445 [Candidatus Acidoferrum sp.]|nr:hypothetical protein [Candidatus Acidoferrum sp.]
MTLCVGFRCRDGVVIAADSQMTGNNLTFPELKLDGLKWVNGRAIWGYSGSIDTARRLRRELASKFGTSANVADVADVHTRLQQSLKAALRPRETFYTLFGVSFPNQNYPTLILSDGKYTSEVDHCDAIGQDSPLVRYLLHLCQSRFVTTTSQAFVAALYIVSQVKAFDGQKVGHGTNVSILRSDPNLLIRVLSRSQEWEADLQTIEEWTMSMLGQLSNSKFDEKTTASNMETYLTRLKEFAVKVRKLDLEGQP